MVLSWVYGMDKTLDNLREMGIRLNKAVSGYWWVVWTILTPIASLVSNTLLLLSIPGGLPRLLQLFSGRFH